MKDKNDPFYQSQAAQLLVKKNGHHQDLISENVNEAAKGAADHILFQYYVKNNPRQGVMVRDAHVTHGSLEEVVNAMTDFEENKDAKELFIPITLYGQHAVHAHVKKTNNDKFVFEYSDPFGSTSPYGNPPKEIVAELERKFGQGNIIFKPTPTVQQKTSSSCFAINYQNMVDKYEGVKPSIKPVVDGKEDPLIKVVRLQMKRDMQWLYEQYNEIWEKVQRHGQEQYPDMVQEREAIQARGEKVRYNDAGLKIVDSGIYDPSEHGHMDLRNAELNKAKELLADIDFSKAPSRTPSDAPDIEFPQSLKTKLQSEGYGIQPLYDSRNLKIIGYSINILNNVSPEQLLNISHKIEKEIPNSLKNNVIFSMKESNGEEERLAYSASVKMS
ncbi:Uncharacterised protein [Legionella busanensis]|uniref:Uncharacterized protein n=1 Tax=Legionella busanensis TaxID=190655 RepID=A0A378JMC0_9GAMM|nr:hypothetical protein [Legionella busanensis]STX51210.1 Uncharacterised protein [Legionella busanensis]